LTRAIGCLGSFFRTIPGGHPGGFCLPRNAADRLAIHTDYPLNLALAFARIQQSLDRNPQIWLQNVHSRPSFRKKGAA
jgi:hypothetical protein